MEPELVPGEQNASRVLNVGLEESAASSDTAAQRNEEVPAVFQRPVTVSTGGGRLARNESTPDAVTSWTESLVEGDPLETNLEGPAGEAQEPAAAKSPPIRENEGAMLPDKLQPSRPVATHETMNSLEAQAATGKKRTRVEDNDVTANSLVAQAGTATAEKRARVEDNDEGGVLASIASTEKKSGWKNTSKNVYTDDEKRRLFEAVKALKPTPFGSGWKGVKKHFDEHAPPKVPSDAPTRSAESLRTKFSNLLFPSVLDAFYSGKPVQIDPLGSVESSMSAAAGNDTSGVHESVCTSHEQPSANNLMVDVGGNMAEETESLSDAMNSLFERLKSKDDAVFDKIMNRLDTIEGKMESLDKKVDGCHRMVDILIQNEQIIV